MSNPLEVTPLNLLVETGDAWFHIDPVGGGAIVLLRTGLVPEAAFDSCTHRHGSYGKTDMADLLGPSR